MNNSSGSFLELGDISSGNLEYFFSDGFPYFVAPVFSTPAFPLPHFQRPQPVDSDTTQLDVEWS